MNTGVVRTHPAPSDSPQEGNVRRVGTTERPYATPSHTIHVSVPSEGVSGSIEIIPGTGADVTV